MRLGRGKPRKKRKNAKARYDKEYPVVPIRLHKSLKKQFVREAEKKGLMLSQYIRDLLQGLEVREKVVEKIVERPVTKTIEKTIESPEKVREIGELKRALRSTKETLSSRESELAESLRRYSAQQQEAMRLEASLSSLSKEYKSLEADHRAKVQEIQAKDNQLKEIRSSIPDKLAALSERSRHAEEKFEKLQSEVSRLSSEKATLSKQLKWALNELKSNDAENEVLAQETADTYGITVLFVGTAWEDMPD